MSGFMKILYWEWGVGSKEWGGGEVGRGIKVFPFPFPLSPFPFPLSPLPFPLSPLLSASLRLCASAVNKNFPQKKRIECIAPILSSRLLV